MYVKYRSGLYIELNTSWAKTLIVDGVRIAEDITNWRRGTTIGHIESYSPDNELFSSYLERVEQFFIANDIKAERKKATFLSLIGSQAYSLLKNLVSPTIPKDNSYAELVAALKKHYEPKPLVIAERFHFHWRA